MAAVSFPCRQSPVEATHIVVSVYSIERVGLIPIEASASDDPCEDEYIEIAAVADIVVPLVQAALGAAPSRANDVLPREGPDPAAVAIEARDFVRRNFLGKKVLVRPVVGRIAHLIRANDGESLSLALVRRGLAVPRSKTKDSEWLTRLQEASVQASRQGKGHWSLQPQCDRWRRHVPFPAKGCLAERITVASLVGTIVRVTVEEVVSHNVVDVVTATSLQAFRLRVVGIGTFRLVDSRVEAALMTPTREALERARTLLRLRILHREHRVSVEAYDADEQLFYGTILGNNSASSGELPASESSTTLSLTPAFVKIIASGWACVDRMTVTLSPSSALLCETECEARSQRVGVWRHIGKLVGPLDQGQRVLHLDPFDGTVVAVPEANILVVQPVQSAVPLHIALAFVKAEDVVQRVESTDGIDLICTARWLDVRHLLREVAIGKSVRCIPIVAAPGRILVADVVLLSSLPCHSLLEPLAASGLVSIVPTSLCPEVGLQLPPPLHVALIDHETGGSDALAASCETDPFAAARAALREPHHTSDESRGSLPPVGCSDTVKIWFVPRQPSVLHSLNVPIGESLSADVEHVEDDGTMICLIPTLWIAVPVVLASLVYPPTYATDPADDANLCGVIVRQLRAELLHRRVTIEIQRMALHIDTAFAAIVSTGTVPNVAANLLSRGLGIVGRAFEHYPHAMKQLAVLRSAQKDAAHLRLGIWSDEFQPLRTMLLDALPTSSLVCLNQPENAARFGPEADWIIKRAAEAGLRLLNFDSETEELRVQFTSSGAQEELDEVEACFAQLCAASEIVPCTEAFFDTRQVSRDDFVGRFALVDRNASEVSGQADQQFRSCCWCRVTVLDVVTLEMPLQSLQQRYKGQRHANAPRGGGRRPMQMLRVRFVDFGDCALVPCSSIRVIDTAAVMRLGGTKADRKASRSSHTKTGPSCVSNEGNQRTRDAMNLLISTPPLVSVVRLAFVTIHAQSQAVLSVLDLARRADVLRCVVEYVLDRVTHVSLYNSSGSSLAHLLLRATTPAEVSVNTTLLDSECLAVRVLDALMVPRRKAGSGAAPQPVDVDRRGRGKAQFPSRTAKNRRL